MTIGIRLRSKTTLQFAPEVHTQGRALLYITTFSQKAQLHYELEAKDYSARKPKTAYCALSRGKGGNGKESSKLGTNDRYSLAYRKLLPQYLQIHQTLLLQIT